VWFIELPLPYDCHGTTSPADFIQGKARYLRMLFQYPVHLCPQSSRPHAMHKKDGGATGVARDGLVNDGRHLVCSHTPDVPAAHATSMEEMRDQSAHADTLIERVIFQNVLSYRACLHGASHLPGVGTSDLHA
jgi:hypothetical protein